MGRRLESLGRRLREMEQIGHICWNFGAIDIREIVDGLIGTRGMRGGIVMLEKITFWRQN